MIPLSPEVSSETGPDRPRFGILACVVVGAAASTLALLVSALAFRSLRTGRDRYDDLIAGEPAFTGYFKNGDIRVVTGYLVALVLLFGLIAVLLARFRPRLLRDRRLPASFFEASTTVPLAVCLVAALQMVLARDLSKTALSIAVLAAVLTALARFGAPSKELLLLWGTVAGALLSACTALVYVHPSQMSQRVVSLLARSGPALAAITVLVTVLTWFFCRSRRVTFPFRRAALVAQVLFPFLLLAPFSGLVVTRGGIDAQLVGPGLRIALFAVAIAVVVVNALIVIGDRSGDGWILATTVPAICGFLAFSPPGVSPLLGDDFHTGEILLQWSEVRAGRFPYTDFIPFPGLIGSVYGWTNDVLLSGLADTFGLARIMVAVFVGTLTGGLLARAVGRRWALALCPAIASLALGSSDRFFLVLPFLVGLCLPSLRRQPFSWLLTWLVGGIVVVLLMPSGGVGAVLATTPVAIWMAWRLLRKSIDSRRLAVSRLELIAGVLVAAVLAVSARLVIAGAETVPVYAAANQLGYGSPWFTDSSRGPVRRLVFEAVRTSGWWLGIPLVLVLGLVAISARRTGSGDGGEVSAPAVFLPAVVLFPVALVPYAFGRVDPGLFTRITLTSVVMLGVLIPIGLALVAGPARATGGHLLVVAALLSFVAMFSRPVVEPSALLDRTIATSGVGEDLLRELPAGAAQPLVAVVGGSEGLPGVKQVMASGTRLSELRAVRDAVRTFVKPGESYLDLTNRSAFYPLLGLHLPTPVAEPFYMPIEQLQDEVIEALDASPPPLVWIGPALVLDGAPASLRSYRVYRWLLENGYRYYSAEGATFLVRSDRVSGEPRAPGQELAELTVAISRTDVQRLPESWGASSDLDRRFRTASSSVKQLSGRSVAHLGSFSLDLDNPVRGDEADFASIDLSCTGPGRAHVRLSWEGDEPIGQRSLTFDARSRVLVPLGAYPTWLLDGSHQRLVGTVEEGTSCGTLTIGEVRLMRLVD